MYNAENIIYELKIRHIISTITYIVILFTVYLGKLLCLKPTAEATKQIFMEKVYLVLRNNREAGPFTIGELLQQQLKPTDLIWIEGHSHSWSPVSSLKLIPLQDLDIPKAQEIKPAQVSLTPPVSSQPDFSFQKTVSTQAYAMQREDEILFIDHRKERKKNLIEWTSGIAVVGFIAVCLVGGIKFFRPKKEIPATVATQIISDESNTAKSVPTPTQTVSTIIPIDTLTVPASPATPSPQVARKKQVAERVKPQMAALITEIEPETTTQNKEEDKTEKVEVVPPKLLVEKNLTIPANTNDPEVDVTEKKKSLGTTLKGLFKKKKKEGDNKE